MSWMTKVQYLAGAGKEFFIFAMKSRLALEPPQLSIQWVPGSFPGIKVAMAQS
jgi:hypothetical protein